MRVRCIAILALAFLLVIATSVRADIPAVLTSPNAAAVLVRQYQQLRNRTEELYAILAGHQDAFRPDEEVGITDKFLSAETFQNILRTYRMKAAASLKEMTSGDLADDYLEDGESTEQKDALGRRVIFNPCSPEHCVAPFSTPENRVPFEVPCSTASGVIPKEPQLPLNFPGNYELCESYGFVHAHFCTIQTFFVVVPLLDPKDKSLFPQAKDYLNIGRLFLGKCVASQCNASLLKRRFLWGLRSTTARLFRKAKHVRLDLIFLESYIEHSTDVHCVKEDTLDQGEEFESMGTMLFIFLTTILVVLALVFTGFHVIYPHTHNKYILSFAWTQNFPALFNPMKGEYVFLNGVRVISMLWVVYGHTVLMSSIGVNTPISNPTAVDTQLQAFSMTYIRAAEYAVDTFFFMSGLLAANGIIEATYTGRMPKLGLFTYFNLILVRFIRLTPVYMFILFFYVKVLPYCGTGPYWFLNNNRHDLEHSCRNWFTNLFYFNNLYPYGPDKGGIQSCMGWTWYLANDMQFFLLAPWLSWFFLYEWKQTRGTQSMWRAIRLYGPCAFLVATQIGTTAWSVFHYDVRGSFDLNYNAYIYVKPWCRMSPYIIGCWLAMYRFDRQQAIVQAQHIDCEGSETSLQPLNLPEDRQLCSQKWCVKHLTAVCAFLLTLFISFIIYDDFRCKAEPHSDCNIWFAFFSYGELSYGNWSKAGVAAYLALGYPAWALALALLTNYAANGNGGIITRVLSLPFFNPLARLSYTVYLIHLVCMQWFFSRAPAPSFYNPMRVTLDAVSITVLAFLVALFLHLLVEKPFTTLLPWCIGFDKEEQRTQRMRASSIPLERELSTVGDVDSETVIIGTPNRRPSVENLEQPLLSQAH